MEGEGGSKKTDLARSKGSVKGPSPGEEGPWRTGVVMENREEDPDSQESTRPGVERWESRVTETVGGKPLSPPSP